ncbi:MAG: hypothetical protein KME42_27970 [Tildeniella nuda ZEHNDER 1965/U140]|nr:hypothetical protein [Tildeniella nuda ZEHNDER 1965/U140]
MLSLSAPLRRLLVSLSFCFVLLLTTACTPKATSPFAQAQQDSTRRGAPTAVAKTAEQGASFNKLFPREVKGYEIIPTQEKKGFAEYKVLQNSKPVAMLSISDTTSLPTAAAKYQATDFKVANYPAVDQGTTATGILINNRYQVKVLSRDPSFTRDDRLAWLQKFDLVQLATFKPAPAPIAKALPARSPAAPLLPAKRPTLTPQPAT